jgi:fatty acid desaturase
MLVSIVVVFLVATRQNVLGLLVHDQAHCLGFKARFGDVITNIIAAYPLLGVTVEGYSKVHLSHHRHFFTDKDPDFLRKSGEDWLFPKKSLALVRIFGRDLLGLNIWALIKGKDLDVPVFNRAHPTPKWVRPVLYLIAAFVLTATGTWHLFLLYWVLPLVTVFQIIVRWGAMCEHIYNMPGASVEESSPIIDRRWWEHLILPDLNFTLHPYHHYFPGIPFCNLRKVHEIFKREGLVDEEKVFHSSWQYLKFLTESGRGTQAVNERQPNWSQH